MTRPAVRMLHTETPPAKWNASRRLRCALANNNNAQWWICLSRTTVANIETRFAEGRMAGLLYEVTGGVLGNHRKLRHDAGEFYLYMQLSEMHEYVCIALADARVRPLSPIAFNKIRHY